MSISIFLVPLAIALIVTLNETAIERLKQQHGSKQKLEPIQTDIVDCKILVKTLQEHGLPVSIISDNCVIMKSGKNELVYNRTDSSQPFFVSANGWNNVDELASDLLCLEEEYKTNVQSYTYNKLMENLIENNMKVTEETILEDNSILITIDI